MPNDVNVRLYHAEWCHFCTDLMPKWLKIEKDLNDMKANLLKDKKINLTVEKFDDKSKEYLANKADIEGFPTIHIIKNGVASEYRGPRTTDAILSEVTKAGVEVTKAGVDDNKTSVDDEVDVLIARMTQHSVKKKRSQQEGAGDVYLHKYQKYKAKYLQAKRNL
jgi:thiol-disulfide isomerase/thioredoxin